MTENPVPGAPEPTQDHRETAGPRAGSPEQPPAGSAPVAASAGQAPENPTLRLDRAEDGAPRPVYPQHQPSQPQPSNSSARGGHPAVRPARGPVRRSLPAGPAQNPAQGQPAQPAYGQSQPGQSHYSHTQHSQSPYGTHPAASRRRVRSMPPARALRTTRRTPRSARRPSASRPSWRASWLPD